ncbi:cobyric acid synthase [Metabacillus sp. JX24]|uniref:cobyric acid synthase n=1 Tax=Metabacillus sp. JX24 TaxID=3240759 RepID=UPI003510A0F8
MELNIKENGKKKALRLMIQGTHSDAGKSILSTALCRIFRQDGYKTAPFKSQNMALNSYITKDGKEIGRAQGVQAEAAGIEADTDMNPILIKPSGEMESQIVFHGRPFAVMNTAVYREDFFSLGLEAIKKSLHKLLTNYDAVVIEGAGSPAEVNLNDRELVNMRVAEIADAPVLLVGDIDRGGVFASLVGTLQLLQEKDRKRVAGVVINKFRGDFALLEPGLQWFEEYTGIPVVGVIPFISDLEIDGEDSLVLNQYSRGTNLEGDLDVAVLSYPRLSNFTDIDPLRLEPDVNIRFVRKASEFGRPDLIILPGSKNTAEDLRFLKETGLFNRVQAAYKIGSQIVGICGGYQMMGEKLFDPEGVESGIREQDGLAIFPVSTVLYADKKTVQTEGSCAVPGYEDLTLSGYEIHMGQTLLLDDPSPFSIQKGTGEGYAKENATGTYLHDVFHNDAFRWRFLNRLRSKKGLQPIERSLFFRELKKREFDRLADHVRAALDLDKIYEIMKRR